MGTISIPYLAADNILVFFLRHGRIGADIHEPQAAFSVEHRPGGGESSGHKADVGVVVVECLVNIAAAEQEVHVLALGIHHNQELDREALQNGQTLGSIRLGRFLFSRHYFFARASRCGSGLR